MHWFSVNSANVVMCDISLKLDALCYASVAESLGVSSTTFTEWAPKATEFGEITHNDDHYAVQGHSRSPILIPVENSYATSY